MIKDLHNDLIQNKINSDTLIDEALKKARNNKLNAFVTVCEPESRGINDNLLSGIPYALKDNFSTKGILTTASSNTLKNYVPIFNSTIYERLQNAGARLIGKTVLDELGMGGTGLTGHTGIVRNPWDTNRICGGSSAGSAASVASGIVPFAIGSDTGDSVRKPAALCGIVGYKPTYGMISRYGLFPFACSLDHVGVLTTSVTDAAIVADTLKGIDKKDMTTWDSGNIELLKGLTGDVKGKRLFYIKEICDIKRYQNPTETLQETLKSFKDNIELIKKLGITVDEVSFDENLLNAIFPTYICLSCAEATSNYSNLTGISFGPRGSGKNINEVMTNHRTEGFSTLIKRRFIIGAYALEKENQEKYYLNACRVRRLIADELNKLFASYDGLILPCGDIAKEIDKIDDVIKDIEVLENHLAMGNFGGFPSITIPSGFVAKMPIGINITGKIKDDANILNIAYAIEKILPYKNQNAKEVK